MKNTNEIKNTEEIKNFKEELEEYDSQGMLLWLNGHISNPEQILNAHLVEEENHYMRDYIPDEKGGIKGLAFDKIRINSETEYLFK